MKATKAAEEYPRRSIAVVIRDGIFSIIGTLLAIAVWIFAGSIFHQSLNLFTRLNATAVNILSAIGEFLIMTACVIVLGYMLSVIDHKGQKKSNSPLESNFPQESQDPDTAIVYKDPPK